MTTDSAVASLQADLTALRAENKELTKRLNELEATLEASADASAAAAPTRRAGAASARCCSPRMAPHHGGML